MRVVLLLGVLVGVGLVQGVCVCVVFVGLCGLGVWVCGRRVFAGMVGMERGDGGWRQAGSSAERSGRGNGTRGNVCTEAWQAAAGGGSGRRAAAHTQAILRSSGERPSRCSSANSPLPSMSASICAYRSAAIASAILQSSRTCSGFKRLVWPQSRMPTRPSSRSSRLPGCGSVWNSPISSTIVPQARCNDCTSPGQPPCTAATSGGHGSRCPLGSARAARTTSSMRVPRSRSSTSTRVELSPGSGAASPTRSLRPARSNAAAKRRVLAASIFRSNSSGTMSLRSGRGVRRVGWTSAGALGAGLRARRRSGRPGGRGTDQ